MNRRKFLIGLAGGLAAAPTLLFLGKAAPADLYPDDATDLNEASLESMLDAAFYRHRGVMIWITQERQGDLTMLEARFDLDGQPLGLGCRVFDEERAEKPGLLEMYRKALIRSCRHTIDWHFYKIRPMKDYGHFTYAQWMRRGAPIPLAR